MIQDSTSSFLTAEEAAEALGISRASLYAYVSRGMIRSEPEPGSRRRRYARDDVERLVDRQAQRRDPTRAAERSLDWGAPVVESAITRIENGRLFYRGHDVLELARERSVEEVAALVWTGDLEAAERLFRPQAGGAEDPLGETQEAAGGAAGRRFRGNVPPAGGAPDRRRFSGNVPAAERTGGAAAPPGLRGNVLPAGGASVGLPGPSALERCQSLLPVAGAADPAAWDLRAAAVGATGARILALVARWCAETGAETAAETGAETGPGAGAETPALADPAGGGIAATLAAGWRLAGRPEAVRAVSAALVLSADHELNVSTFTARCVASAGSTPYDAVAAGLAALKGTRHGGVTGRVEALLREVGTPAAARRMLADRLRRGEEVPGFGHRLYPEGDPRGRALLELAAALGDAGEGPAAAALPLAVAAAAEELLGERPNLDLGLVALARALALPDGAALTLFAAGRVIGWIGHALEEYARGRLIRPRARYVGV